MGDNINFETWHYDEHTKIKHQVFSDYFDKWVKILGKFHMLIYFDCFAGCGAYKDKAGNIYFGSPVLAAETIKRNNKKAVLVFIDKEKKNLENVKKVLEYKGLTNLKVLYIDEDFDKTINEVLSENTKLSPAMFFIDPWGFKIKYETLKRIMGIEKSEIILNFMFEAINRFLGLRENEKIMNELFGSDEWKKVISLSGRNRENEIISLYKNQLEKIAKFVYPYKIEHPRRRRTFYYLFHLTNYWKGCSIMKSSFAKYNQGRVAYLGKRSAQRMLNESKDFKLSNAKNYLIEKYKGLNKTYLEIIEENISKTDFLESEIRYAIKNGEEKSEVYIERYPKLTEKEKKLRKSIEENDIVYFNCFPAIERKSLLYQTKVEYGDYTINHILGCAHGCNYPCYARMMAIRYGNIKDYDDWLRPRIVSNALELLDKELPKYKSDIRFVHLCFMSDPFMYDFLNKRPFKQIEELTLKIIEKINSYRIKCTLLTKGVYPKVLADSNRFSRENEYGITLVSLDPKFKKEYEPFSAEFKDRINALKYLHDNGLKTWVSMEPYPTPNIVDQDIEDILEKISFVNKIIFGKMNYNINSARFENNWSFYKECVRKIEEFCKKNNIEYYIKKGTPSSGNNYKKIFD